MILRSHQKGDAASIAEYSDCERYRYSLTRVWDGTGRKAAFVMLNPSTATEIQNDPTVERCERRARTLGFGAFQVTNIFAWRDTDPRAMRAADRSGWTGKRQGNSGSVGLGRSGDLRLGHAWRASRPRSGGRSHDARHRQTTVYARPDTGRASQAPAIYWLPAAAGAMARLLKALDCHNDILDRDIRSIHENCDQAAAHQHFAIVAILRRLD